MVIIATIFIAFCLAVANINPIALAKDNFFIFQSKASGGAEPAPAGIVLGVSEDPDNGTDIAGDLSADQPAAEPANKILSGPVLKSEFEKAPEISAMSAVVIDATSGRVLFRQDASRQAPLASITKLMTAIVVFDQNPDWQSEYIMQSDDRREGGRINLFLGDKITMKDLLNASLVGSDNTATIALVHALGFDEEAFVEKMRQKAREFDLQTTVFVDPIGLSSNNKSTASDVAQIAKAAFSNEEIKQIVKQKRYVLKTKQGKTRVIESTDYLLSAPTNYQVLGGKTGSLGNVGIGFTGKFSKDGHEIISAVLGSDGVEARFSDTDTLVSWVFGNYSWR